VSCRCFPVVAAKAARFSLAIPAISTVAEVIWHRPPCLLVQ